ncbi:hypothetical protein KIN20_023469 [Parelaphostrongylus tenuis]|uniref:Nucleolar protein 10 n=1 Tax=Parelaphostrongylus tenuis TaxID=148309 RepID=A0AAD5MRP7_PARTN|nr:hypothetical protein KIN20_023469 [Parelaphostrongylus tenuis]
MQVSSINDVRIYNLSSGKSVPEWMSSEARRKAERRNIDVRRRVQLIQDFEMPDVSHTVDVSQDGRYVFATGSYKSWLKCYDLENLSLKFQRGLDAAVIKLISLGDDYSKIILLEEDRFLEMHAAFGRYFRMRIPRFGRDMAYSLERSDLHLVGASSEVYRLNLELGEWLSPLQTNGNALNCCTFAQPHQLFVCGTTDGQVEAWDHRDKSRVGVLDCLPYLQDVDSGRAEITSLNFRDALCLGVGTSTGHVMLYDIRSRKPFIVKDHINCLPVKKIDFASRGSENLVLSMDSRVLKIWNESDGKPFAAVETECVLNDFCRYFDSGLIFFANEGSRLQQFFIPALGTAPKWCYYLETITEELEENQPATLYDDYKFVTKEELDKLGLSNLIGTSVLRAYMHGYFLDRRLYDKAQLLSQPDAYEKYMNRKIHDLVHQERERKVIDKNPEVQQPKVNKELATRLRAEAASEGSVTNLNKKKKNEKKKAVTASAILGDERFKDLFDNQDFEIDQHCEQFKRNALIKQKGSSVKRSAPSLEENFEDEDEMELSGLSLADISDNIPHGDHDVAGSSSDSDTDEILDEKAKKKREKSRQKIESLKRHRQLYEEKMLMREAELTARLVNKPKKFVLHELDSTESAQDFLDQNAKEVDNSEDSSSLAAKKMMMQRGKESEQHEDVLGGRSMTFSLAKRGASAREFKELEDRKKHAKERRTTVRVPTSNIKRSLKKLPGKLSRS